jgi:REP element-mobilizing transposase RayT
MHRSLTVAALGNTCQHARINVQVDTVLLPQEQLVRTTSLRNRSKETQLPETSDSSFAAVLDETWPVRAHAGTDYRTSFVTFTCYGTWLHGDPRGSIDREHNHWQTPPLESDEIREREEFLRLKHAPVVLSTSQRRGVAAAIQEVAEHRHWKLHALNVRTNHIHIVVTANRHGKRVLVDFKSYGTRRLKFLNDLPSACLTLGDDNSNEYRVWTRGGSARPVGSENAFRRAIEYTLDEQGVNQPGTCFGSSKHV